MLRRCLPSSSNNTLVDLTVKRVARFVEDQMGYSRSGTTIVTPGVGTITPTGRFPGFLGILLRRRPNFLDCIQNLNRSPEMRERLMAAGVSDHVWSLSALIDEDERPLGRPVTTEATDLSVE
jgi:hypothetical protein